MHVANRERNDEIKGEGSERVTCENNRFRDTIVLMRLVYRNFVAINDCSSAKSESKN